MDVFKPEHLLFLPEKLTGHYFDDGLHPLGEMFTVPASAHTWGDIARANRNDEALDSEFILDDILDATEIG